VNLGVVGLVAAVTVLLAVPRRDIIHTTF